MPRSVKPLSIGFMQRMYSANGARLFRGFRSIAVAQGWRVHILRSWDPDERVAELIQRWSLDGAFVQGDLYQQLGAKTWGDCPVVTFSPVFPPADAPPQVRAVAFDDHAIGEAAAKHLLSRGLQQFGFLFIGNNTPFADDRFEGFKNALCGMPLDRANLGELVELHPEPWELRGLGPWLTSLPKPCGIFAPCDIWGIIVLGCCMAAGISVPEEIAVIGVDGDDNLCEFNTPSLTSINLPWEEMGRAAALQILDLQDRQKKRQPGTVLRLPPGHIIARKSTDVLAVGNRDVREALAMIAAEALGPLRPADVISSLGVSRNKFRDDFHRLVGHTLSDEIRRVRVEEAKRLLSQCDLPVDEIAGRCGFATPAMLHGAFLQVVGATPGAFRKRQQQ